MVATNGPNKRSVLVGAVARESRRRYNYFANLSTLIAHDVLLIRHPMSQRIVSALSSTNRMEIEIDF